MSHEGSSVVTAPHPAPVGEHDRVLRDAVRPPQWRNPEARPRYNLVVLGGGTAGLVAAFGAAGLGAKVALVERERLGGDCLNVGCVPSKALLRCARAAAQVRDASRFGVRTNGVATVDFAAVTERMRRIRASLASHDSAARLRDAGVDVFFGAGRFVAPDCVEVDHARLRFARACIATGARAAVPDVPGLVDAGVLTNETVFSLTELPRRLAVIGGGSIGCELAQAFARFGSTVLLVEAAERLLPHDHVDAAEIVANALRRDGVEVRLGTAVASVAVDGHAKRLRLAGAGVDDDRTVDAILVAVGRTPNVEGLGLEAAGVECDQRAGVHVDERLRTRNPRIYAAGDVCLPYKFTHAADASARLVLRNALFFGRAAVAKLVVPWCTFTEPEVAHVGLTAAELKRKGIDATTIRIEMRDVDRARLDGEEDGFFEVHVSRNRILGATLVSSHAGETISEITAAITARIGLTQLADTIHCYPTQAEVIKKAADAHNRSRLTPGVKRAFEGLLAVRRASR